MTCVYDMFDDHFGLSSYDDRMKYSASCSLMDVRLRNRWGLLS